jgi:hypothetical protein
MKILAPLLAFAALALGVICLLQYDKLIDLKTKLAAVAADSDQKSRDLFEMETARKQIEQQQQDLRRQADTLTAQLQERHAAEQKLAAAVASVNSNRTAAAKPDSAGGLGSMVSKMMSDPGMKKMIRDQQRSMMDSLYTPLMKRLALSPEETAKFKDLLADNMMSNAEKATAMMGATNRADMVATMTAEQKTFAEQVKAFLGDERYAQYQDYQMTVGERMQLNMLKQQGGDNPLSDAQTDQLLGIMKEEKQKVGSELGQNLSGPAGEQAKLEAMLSDEQADKLFQSQEAVNARVYDRAKDVLSAEQLDAFGKFQTNQISMMHMGINMAKKMFAPEQK